MFDENLQAIHDALAAIENHRAQRKERAHRKKEQMKIKKLNSLLNK